METNVKNSNLIKKLLNFTYRDDVNAFVAHTILVHLSDIEKLNSTKLADLCLTTQSTISKFVAKLGYDSFNSFKQEIIKYKGKKMLLTKDKQNSLLQFNNNVALFLKVLSNYDFKQIALMIKQAQKILIITSGGSYRALFDIYTHLQRMGLNIKMSSDFASKYAQAYNSDENTLVIMVSNSATTAETIIPSVLATNNGAALFAFCNHAINNLTLKQFNNFIIQDYCDFYVDPLLFNIFINLFFTNILIYL
ncbi:MurR/RpiR family transcriptional regulator [Mycoplasma sp. NEAQ87857]|uniref:MurR/RpiR family transcriptional regulator n=1 Tax=Mycoplasma sp. NEAQ87857 TaxID=2683967 RepID=UPI00131AD66A|nr:SIS domain-containing protein [Mycoplasma sp. NEAQ87857]